jgi:hypothetical protein
MSPTWTPFSSFQTSQIESHTWKVPHWKSEGRSQCQQGREGVRKGYRVNIHEVLALFIEKEQVSEFLKD